MAGFTFGDYTSARQFHLKTLPEEVGKYVILVGDPGRVNKIAPFLQDARQISVNREYHIFTGTLEDEMVSICSTGIGGPSTAIAVEELVRCGAHTMIRVGTSGGMDLKVQGGDLVVASSAIRAEGTSYEYLPMGYPAAADFQVTQALKQAGDRLLKDDPQRRCHVGVVQSKDSFYGEVAPETMPVSYDLNQRVPAYLAAGCLATEMECAALFSVGLVRHIRCGAVLTALWNDNRIKAGLTDTHTEDSSCAIACGLEAMRLLIQEDRQQRQ